MLPSKLSRDAGCTRTRFGSSFGSVSRVLGRSLQVACAALSALVQVVPLALVPLALVPLALLPTSCGEHGLLPTSVDPGSDFVQEEVTFDEQFYYCRVEPMLFQQSCGSGVAGTDPVNGCHFSVTKFRLTDYGPPRVSESCNGGDAPAAGTLVPVAAQQNYAAAQARMKRDPTLAALLLRPTAKARHPRKIFEENSDEAAVIRQWATQLAGQ